MIADGSVGTVGQCEYCGQAFDRSNGRGRPRRYCSNPCKAAAHRERHKLAQCQVRVARWACDQFAAGDVGTGPAGTGVRACQKHQGVAVDLVTGRDPQASWVRYEQRGRPESAVEQDEPEPVEYCVLYAGGWGLYEADRLAAVMNDAPDQPSRALAGAQLWLRERRKLAVQGWSVRGHRTERDAVEYVAVIN